MSYRVAILRNHLILQKKKYQVFTPAVEVLLNEPKEHYVVSKQGKNAPDLIVQSGFPAAPCCGPFSLFSPTQILRCLGNHVIPRSGQRHQKKHQGQRKRETPQSLATGGKSWGRNGFSTSTPQPCAEGSISSVHAIENTRSWNVSGIFGTFGRLVFRGLRLMRF